LRPISLIANPPSCYRFQILPYIPIQQVINYTPHPLSNTAVEKSDKLN
jgi:hypothetical protein